MIINENCYQPSAPALMNGGITPRNINTRIQESEVPSLPESPRRTMISKQFRKTNMLISSTNQRQRTRNNHQTSNRALNFPSIDQIYFGEEQKRTLRVAHTMKRSPADQQQIRCSNGFQTVRFSKKPVAFTPNQHNTSPSAAISSRLQIPRVSKMRRI